MGGVDDILQKRLLLSTVRMRFSPQVQKIREDWIDGVVEHILATAPENEFYPPQWVQKIFSESAGFHITYRDVYNSLQRLLGKSRVELAPAELSTAKLKVKGRKKELFKLSSDARKELEGFERETTRKFNSIVNRLFRDAEHGPSGYAAPFLEFLSIVFSKLANEYVQMLKGEISEGDFVSSPVFSSALNQVKEDLNSLNPLLFENAAISFFSESDPEYASLKWNLAQSFYALRAIGLDGGGLLLSKELFGDAMFYLDTNVVISALAPEEVHHAGFVALSEACKRLGVKIKVCKITFDELDRTVNAHISMIRNVIDQIPEQTAVKISSDFFEIYHEKMKADADLPLDEAFAKFFSAESTLREHFDIEIEDDYWFEEVAESEKTNEFVRVIGQRFLEMSRRKKTEPACVHDSLCLQWMDECRTTTGNPNVWIITRDHTLPGCVPAECCSKSLAITLDALLQWLSPITEGEGEETGVAMAYSQMIASHILPQERIFNLEDFLIFHELNMTCKELPAEDVEGCVRHIKINAPLLNPMDPVDREKLAHAVASYFADPTRKYQQNLLKYEAEISQIKRDLSEEKSTSLKKDAWLRVSNIASLFLLLEIVVAIMAANYGVGDNVFQRIVSSWPILVALAPICSAAGWFYIGKKRLRALGWPIPKIFKDE